MYRLAVSHVDCNRAGKRCYFSVVVLPHESSRCVDTLFSSSVDVKLCKPHLNRLLLTFIDSVSKIDCIITTIITCVVSAHHSWKKSIKFIPVFVLSWQVWWVVFRPWLVTSTIYSVRSKFFQRVLRRQYDTLLHCLCNWGCGLFALQGYHLSRSETRKHYSRWPWICKNGELIVFFQPW